MIAHFPRRFGIQQVPKELRKEIELLSITAIVNIRTQLYRSELSIPHCILALDENLVRSSSNSSYLDQKAGDSARPSALVAPHLNQEKGIGF